VLAHLDATGFACRVVVVAPAAVLEAPAQARLLLFRPEVADAALTLRELAALRGSSALDAAAAAFSEPDLERRRALLESAHAALLDEAALVPLAVVPVALGARPGLHGLRIDAGGHPRLEDAWIEP
jgi:MarR-like DNA-binding transcriptional regulator SgrR of sgrS sRNA